MGSQATTTDTSSAPKCRVALVGLNTQRVAKVVSLLKSDVHHNDGGTSSTRFISPIGAQYAWSESGLPEEIPRKVEIEYLPCVATFDSYEDEAGNTVRYLVKLEYHGEHGTLVRGKSLAPFFDETANEVGNPFPGITAVAVGCGIDADEDVEKVASFIGTLSSSCRKITNTEADTCSELLVECIQCNTEFSSMKEENEAYRDLSEDEKKKASSTQSLGPGKMAKFVYELGQKAVCQRWSKELEMLEQAKNAVNQDPAQTNVLAEAPKQQQLSQNDVKEAVPVQQHIPDPDKTRYACKRCRTVLFGENDLEDPPHAQSLHNFRKKTSSKSMQSKVCANHFLSGPLPWMSELNDMEGKLHCFKCDTKVGHYSWTGAQCSCGTWVTPAIMVPMSKVDEMPPAGSLFVDPRNIGGVMGFGVAAAGPKIDDPVILS
jgi:hypothetical protein